MPRSTKVCVRSLPHRRHFGALMLVTLGACRRPGPAVGATYPEWGNAVPAPALRPGRLAVDLQLGLQPVQVGVTPVAAHQLVVGAPLDDLALVEHVDAVRAPHRGEAVGDEQ